jgi:hypothetical protein
MSGDGQSGHNSISALLAKAQQTIERARGLRATAERSSGEFCADNKPGFTFLITDLRLGMTFARIGSQSPQGSEKRTRNQANARRTYDSISRINDHASLDEKERREINGKLAQLRSALMDIGEVFP